eukprot:1806835-Rhodomonas_salina.3
MFYNSRLSTPLSRHGDDYDSDLSADMGLQKWVNALFFVCTASPAGADVAHRDNDGRLPMSRPPPDRTDEFMQHQLKLERFEDLRRLFLLKSYNVDSVLAHTHEGSDSCKSSFYSCFTADPLDESFYGDHWGWVGGAFLRISSEDMAKRHTRWGFQTSRASNYDRRHIHRDRIMIDVEYPLAPVYSGKTSNLITPHSRQTTQT